MAYSCLLHIVQWAKNLNQVSWKPFKECGRCVELNTTLAQTFDLQMWPWLKGINGKENDVPNVHIATYLHTKFHVPSFKCFKVITWTRFLVDIQTLAGGANIILFLFITINQKSLSCQNKQFIYLWFDTVQPLPGVWAENNTSVTLLPD